MYIKAAGGSIRDVFLAKGWNNWIRYEKQPDGKWVRVAGLTPNQPTEQQIKRRLETWGQQPNITERK